MKAKYTKQQIMLASDEQLYEMSANTDSQRDIANISAELHYRQARERVKAIIQAKRKKAHDAKPKHNDAPNFKTLAETYDGF